MSPTFFFQQTLIMAFSSLPIFFFFVFVSVIFPISHSIPFIVIHGLGDQCSNEGMRKFTKYLSDNSGSKGYCIEIGNGVWDSWFMPLRNQTQILCNKVKNMKQLRKGYNIVGLSQGNLIGRGVVEFCEGAPPVRNFISLAGPHAGTASAPFCGSGIWCMVLDNFLKLFIYSDIVQNMLAPSGYIKLPNAIPDYLASCKFLPKLNNERPLTKISAYKERFRSLKNLVLIMFENDTVLIPKETSWFGYYPDGEFEPILPPQQKKLYTEDWIGLRSLDEAGRVKFIKVSGGHLQISYSDARKHIVPYLKDQPQLQNKYISWS